MFDVLVLGDGTLAEAIRKNLPERKLADPTCLKSDAIVWMAYDTPVVAGRAAVHAVKQRWDDHYQELELQDHTVVISSQLPLGSCQWFDSNYQCNTFVVVPENIRAAHNIQDWAHQQRMVVGCRTIELPEGLEQVLKLWTDHIMRTTPEEAELIKSATNGFLALCIAYANELGDLCRTTDCNPDVVSTGLRTDYRVSAALPLIPGGPFDSGHLERELANLEMIGGGPLIQAITLSNEQRKQYSS